MAERTIDMGSYTCQAVSADIIEKDGKEPSVELRLRVVEGPDTGRDLVKFSSFHPNAAQFTLEMLRHCGWTGNDVTDMQGLGSVKVIVRGKANEYNGKARQDWMVFPMRVPQPKLEESKKADFAARFKALAIATKPVEVVAGVNTAGTLPEARANHSTAPAAATAPGVTSF